MPGLNRKKAESSAKRARNLAFLLIVTMFFCTGCRYSAAPYYGKLLLVDEQGVAIIDLPSTNQTMLLPISHPFSHYGHPTLVTPGVFFLSNTQRLAEFDLTTRKLTDMGPGVSPTYVPEHRLLFFWDSNEGARQPHNQVVRVRSVDGPADERIVASFTALGHSRVVQISPDEVVFGGEGDRVWRFSIARSTLLPTTIEGCLPMAWRSRTHQLICQDAHDRRAYLSDLDGRNVSVPIHAYEVLGYSPTYDAVIYSAAYGLPWNFAVGWAILAYNFRDHRTVRLAWTKPGASGILLDREGRLL